MDVVIYLPSFPSFPLYPRFLFILLFFFSCSIFFCFFLSIFLFILRLIFLVKQRKPGHATQIISPRYDLGRQTGIPTEIQTQGQRRSHQEISKQQDIQADI